MSWNYQFTMNLQPGFTDEDLLFVRQLGVPNVYTWIPTAQHNLKDLRALKERIESQDLRLYNILSEDVSKNAAIHLNLPGRDDAIARLIELLYMMKELGLNNLVFTWEPDRVWSSGRAESRLSDTRHVDMGEIARQPLTHDRVYTREELWENFAYLMDKVGPALKETGVHLSLHPNDPPTELLMGGVPALINSFDAYKKAFGMLDNTALQMEFCCGCWLEGANEGFANLLDGLRWCLEQGRVSIVHFRNIDRPLPVFTETFLDNGFFDMYRIMKMLCAYDYQGTITLDHTPMLVQDPNKRAASAYAIGYMRALAERAIAEVKR